MKRTKTILITLSTSLLLVADLANAQTSAEQISGDAGNGKQLYYQHGCYGCHGYNGIGKRNLANDVSAIMFDEGIFLSYLRARNNLKPSLPSQKMPSFSKQDLPDEQALDIYAYIRSFKDTQPAIDEIPVLNDILQEAKQRANQ